MLLSWPTVTKLWVLTLWTCYMIYLVDGSSEGLLMEASDPLDPPTCKVIVLDLFSDIDTVEEIYGVKYSHHPPSRRPCSYAPSASRRSPVSRLPSNPHQSPPPPFIHLGGSSLSVHVSPKAGRLTCKVIVLDFFRLGGEQSCCWRSPRALAINSNQTSGVSLKRLTVTGSPSQTPMPLAPVPSVPPQPG